MQIDKNWLININPHVFEVNMTAFSSDHRLPRINSMLILIFDYTLQNKCSVAWMQSNIKAEISKYNRDAATKIAKDISSKMSFLRQKKI